ncbi:MAG: hypothetical protein IPP71_06550 [Bacteroidetes bacterium]|nr:hypothetical protein [Bacteroidota bacterium]
MKKVNATLILILIVKILFAQTPQLWGLASLGGSNNKGLIFKINGDGTDFSAIDSLNYYVGSSPRGSLTMVSGNKLLGLTSNGGGGAGTIFSFDLSNNSCTPVFSFTGLYGGNSYGNNLLLASNGMLYGMTTNGGLNNFGVVFKVDPTNNSFTKLHDFNGLNGKQPYGSLIEANNGNLYGMTFWGGANSNGVIFKYDTTNFTYSVIYNLMGNNDGKFPYGSLLQGINGKLYGLTSSGGINGTGT